MKDNTMSGNEVTIGTVWPPNTPTVQIPITDYTVSSPKHYTSHPSGVECITISEHYNFCIGNAIKYLWRAGLKNEASLSSKEKEIQDLEKAIWYIQRQIQNLQK